MSPSTSASSLPKFSVNDFKYFACTLAMQDCAVIASCFPHRSSITSQMWNVRHQICSIDSSPLFIDYRFSDADISVIFLSCHQVTFTIIITIVENYSCKSLLHIVTPGKVSYLCTMHSFDSLPQGTHHFGLRG